MEFNAIKNIESEIESLKRRIEDLEIEGYKIIEDSFTLLNNEELEDEIAKVEEQIRKFVAKFGIITISITTERP